MKKIVIIGFGGFGREVAWLIERINQKQLKWDLLGFIDDNPQYIGKIINGYSILGNSDWLLSQSEDLYCICAIANSQTRKKVINKVKTRKFATLIDPTVKTSNSVKIGEGCIICADSILTVNIKIESHVIINLDCTVGHDAIIKAYSTLYPSVNVSGNTLISECVEMGTKSCIIQGLNIGENSIIGASSTVVKNIPNNCTAVGTPAKPIKYHDEK